MPELYLTQADIAGGDSDGSRDGRYMRNASPAGCYAGGVEYYTIADARVGHIKLLGSPVCQADYCHWLRFRLPLDQDENIDITEARLRLYWNTNLDVDPDQPNRPANIGLSTGEELSIKIGVYASDDAPIPSSAADARTKADSISTWHTWSDTVLDTNEGRYVDLVQSSSFCEIDVDALIEEATIRRGGWTNNNDILIFIEPYVNPGVDTRYAKFRSWSWLKWQISEGELAASEIDTAPQLYINYTYNTPGSELGAHVEHELTFTQSIRGFNTTIPPVEHELEIIQDLSVAVEYGRQIEHVLEIEQFYKQAETREFDVVSDIDLIQNITYELDRDTVMSELAITQDITVNKIFTRGVEHQLNFIQTVENNFFEKTIWHQLDFTQEIDLVDASYFSRHIEHELGFIQEISFTGSFSLDVEHVLNITQVFTGYVEGSGQGAVCDRKDLLWSPTGDFVNEPVLSTQGSMLLEYPVGAPTHTVTLPQPLLSNREELNKTRIQRKTRAGTLKTYTDPNWPESEVFRFKFQDLTDTQKTDLFTFIGASLAQEIKLVDHEGRQWIGVISNPNGEYTQIFDECGHTAEFDFQIIRQISVQIKAATITLPNTLGNTTYTIDGFIGTPKAAFLITSGNNGTTPPLVQENCSICFGATDGVSQRSVSGFFRDAVSTTDATRYRHDASIIRLMGYTGDYTFHEEAFVEFIEGGIKTNVTQHDSNDDVKAVLILFGGDIEAVKLVEIDPGPIASGTATGFGFTPKTMLMISQGTALNTDTTQNIIAFGASHYDGVTIHQRSLGWGLRAAKALSENSIWYDNDGLIGQTFPTTTDWTLQITSLTSDGFNYTTSQPATADADTLICLAFDFGDLVNVDIGQFATPTVSGQQEITGVGFKPSLIFGAQSVLEGAYKTIDAESQVYGCFVATPTTQVSISNFCENATSPTVAKSAYRENPYGHYGDKTTSPAWTNVATWNGFTNDGWTWTFDASVNSNVNLNWYIAFGT